MLLSPTVLTIVAHSGGTHSVIISCPGYDPVWYLHYGHLIPVIFWQQIAAFWSCYYNIGTSSHSNIQLFHLFLCSFRHYFWFWLSIKSNFFMALYPSLYVSLPYIFIITQLTLMFYLCFYVHSLSFLCESFLWCKARCVAFLTWNCWTLARRQQLDRTTPNPLSFPYL